MAPLVAFDRVTVPLLVGESCPAAQLSELAAKIATDPGGPGDCSSPARGSLNVPTPPRNFSATSVDPALKSTVPVSSTSAAGGDARPVDMSMIEQPAPAFCVPAVSVPVMAPESVSEPCTSLAAGVADPQLVPTRRDARTTPVRTARISPISTPAYEAHPGATTQRHLSRRVRKELHTGRRRVLAWVSDALPDLRQRIRPPAVAGTRDRQEFLTLEN
jgi:hypothetical protein